MKYCMCGKEIRPYRNLCKTCYILKQQEEGKQRFIERLKEKAPFFEYVSGNPNNDGIVIVKCTKCGTITQRNASMVRNKKKTTCLNCKEIEIKQRRQTKEYLKQLEKEKLEADRFNRGNQLTITINECKECGCLFLDNNSSKYCSSKCRSRNIQRRHDKKRLERAKQNGLVDSSITLLKLIKRDNGICYICGNKVNLEDYITKDNNVICGNYYPSIDHIIPLSKGGTHSWSNIKLAHRICNSLKGDRTLPHI